MIKPSYLLMLCFSAPVFTTAALADAPLAVQAEKGQQTRAPWTTPNLVSSCTQLFIVNFPEPMVRDSEVGKAVTPCNEKGEGGYYAFSGTGTVEATWISTSSFRVKLNPGPGRGYVCFRVPGGIKAVSGNTQQGLERRLGYGCSVDINVSSHYVTQSTPVVFFAAEDEETLGLVASAVPQAYFSMRRNGNDKEPVRHPANVRQATMGDALQNWQEFSDLFGYRELSEKDKEFFQTTAPSTLLPGVWCVDFPSLPQGIATADLMLPGLGYFNSGKSTFDDKEIHSFSLSEFEAVLRNDRTDEGHYNLHLGFSHPMGGNVEELFRSTKWECDAGSPEDFSPMEWDGNRQAFISKCDAGEVVLKLDKEATLAHAKDTVLRPGETVRTINTLEMKATTPAPDVRIRAVSPFTSLYGKVYKEPTMDKKWYFRDITTKLTPKKPLLYTDLIDAGMRGEGKRSIHCITENVNNVRVSVYRIESKGDAVPRLLLGYSKLYPAGQGKEHPQRKFIESWYSSCRPTSKGAPIPAELLPGAPEKAETVLTPDDKGKCTLDPSALFPGKGTHATYFVSMEADAAPEYGKDKYVINQGIVQMTDLGLMWKLSSRNILAYAYRLSDGKPLPEAVVLMLDAGGKEIGRLTAKDGIAMGTLPDKVRFLQVQSGDDCYTTKVSRAESHIWCSDERWLAEGIDPTKLMQLKSCIFKDRSLYREGETAHIKGILRMLQGDELSIPEVESITAKVRFGRNSKEVNAKCEPDGTFTLDLPIEEGWRGYGSVNFTIKYKGDDNDTAADMLAAKEAGLMDLDESDVRSFKSCNRREYISISVEDFRRNEFEVSSTLEAVPGTRTVKLTAEARDFNTAPVANGKVEWNVEAERVNFYPQGFKDYRFGDHVGGDDSYFNAYYGNGRLSSVESEHARSTGSLDKDGKGSAELTINDFIHPGRYRVVSWVNVTNGNEQTLRSRRTTMVEASGVYAGIKGTDKLVHAGTPIKLDALLVTPEGKAWSGAALPATVKVKRTVFAPYRYGTKLRSAIRNEKIEEEYPAREISLSGTPAAFEVPTTIPGTYDIVIEGKDAEGKPYYTAVRKYVWGDGYSPWEYGNGTSLELTADKDVYKVGDTAKILVQTPVDAELLVTVEREGVRRYFKRSITVGNPILELPVEAGDAPFCRVSVFLVQGAENRTANGKPVLKHATLDLHVDMPEKRLAVKLDTPAQPITPTEQCTLAGTVTGSDGKPVANAEITLYAEDEGTLQVTGYANPAPYAAFYDERAIGVATFHTLGQLIGDVNTEDYGNKGIFIGGGSNCESADSVADGDTSTDRGPRKDFNPCAVWIGRVVTDAEGRFSTTYTNPDTMTRYRVIAVATAGADKFGTGESSYVVAKPIMLEPSAPLTATEGDRLDVPVTVTMLPKMMPAGTNGPVQWKVALQGGANISVPADSQTVTLNGESPTTIHFPVTMKGTGAAELTWSVAPASPQPGMEKLTDAVQLGFDVVPPTPHLRLPMVKAIAPGQKVKPAALLSERLRPESKAELLVSLSPLSGAVLGMDYLFKYPYGCSEQLSSTLLPWLMQDTLQKWVDVPFPAGTQAATVERNTVNKLLKRQLYSGAFGYWDGDGKESGFTPYVCLALSYSPYAMGMNAIKEDAAGYLERTLKRQPDGNLLAMLALARISPERAARVYSEVLAKRSSWTPADRLLFACGMLECQERLQGRAVDGAFGLAAKEAVKAADEALAGATQDWQRSYYEPPTEALKMLFRIKSGQTGLVADMRKYIRETMSQPLFYTTWNNAWSCIVIEEFCKTYSKQVQFRPVEVNGRKVELGNPLRLSGALKDLPDISTKGGFPVYLTGVAEGYSVQPQKVEAVNNGFLVQRNYEKLTPEGRWEPTGVLQVGDVVRVTFTAHATDKINGGYIVAEDRLPAGFEAINPELPSQDLPGYVRPNGGLQWYTSPFIDHKEYHKDRVRFFITDYRNGADITAFYIARVVKSGHMTAPAAKVEMMYSPGNYGLSIPQEFTVTPRK